MMNKADQLQPPCVCRPMLQSLLITMFLLLLQPISVTSAQTSVTSDTASPASVASPVSADLPVLIPAPASPSEQQASPGPEASTHDKSAPAADLIQVGNLIYAKHQYASCFSDRFLQRALAETTIRTTGKLHPVPLAGSDLAPFPLLILAGEKNFTLTPDEREQLKNYLQQGGFLLASAGCSSKQFDQSFRRELAELYPDTSLEPVPFTHPLFHTLRSITSLQTKMQTDRTLLGLTLQNRLVLIYAPDGLNATDSISDCCCCGGQELLHAADLNLNILAYVLGF